MKLNYERIKPVIIKIIKKYVLYIYVFNIIIIYNNLYCIVIIIR